jgi:hypothetical protein
VRASLTSFFNDPVLHVSACSLWPGRLNYGRACLGGFEARRQARIRVPIANGPSTNT